MKKWSAMVSMVMSFLFHGTIHFVNDAYAMVACVAQICIFRLAELVFCDSVKFTDATKLWVCYGQLIYYASGGCCNGETLASIVRF